MRRCCLHFPARCVFSGRGAVTMTGPRGVEMPLVESAPIPLSPESNGCLLGAGTMQNAPLTGNAGSMQPLASADDRSGTAVTGFSQWETSCFGSLAWLMLL